MRTKSPSIKYKKAILDIEYFPKEKRFTSINMFLLSVGYPQRLFNMGYWAELQLSSGVIEVVKDGKSWSRIKNAEIVRWYHIKDNGIKFNSIW